MQPVVYLRPTYPPDAFAGTAQYYRAFRVPYPAALVRDLIGRCVPSGRGRLLDLACGPGRTTFALAPWFAGADAVDLEPEMVDAARQEAGQRGITGISWHVGRAEDLAAPAASFELVTIGEAFHRLDQKLIARRCLDWLRPGGAVATIGCYGILNGPEAWQRLVTEIVAQWTGRASANGGVALPGGVNIGPLHDEAVLRDSGFAEVGSHPFAAPHEWTIEAIIGNLYSTSVCSKRVLGTAAPAFESALSAALLAHDPGGVYRENLRFGYTFGRKPL